MPHLSCFAGALALPLFLAGCVGAPAVVEPAYGPAPVALQPAYPTPVALAPAAPVQTAYGSSCFAGFYQCQLPAAGPLGSQCTCPGLGGPSYGTIR